MHKARTSALLATLLALTGPAHSQSPPAPGAEPTPPAHLLLPPQEPALPTAPRDAELQSLEDEYATDLIEIRRELGEKYLGALERLQANLTARKQIEQALLVKLERERVTELLDTAPVLEAPDAGAQPQVEVKLDISRARYSGGTNYDTEAERIRNWSAAGATALWDLDAEMPPGRYELIVTYGTSTDGGGTFEIVTSNATPVTGSVGSDTSAAWADRKLMLAGHVVIGPGSRSLALTCTTLRHTYLWTLYGAKLAPEGTWAQMEKHLGLWKPHKEKR